MLAIVGYLLIAVVAIVVAVVCVREILKPDSNQNAVRVAREATEKE